MVPVRRSAAAFAPLAVLAALAALAGCSAPPAVTVARDDAAGALTVSVGGREAFVFNYGGGLDLPHYWPLRTPSGRNLLVQKTEPYPHHRSFWFADTVRPAGGDRDLSFYNALYSGIKAGSGDYGPPYRERIRLAAFPKVEAKGGRAEVAAELVWESDGRAILRETRVLAVHSLGAGEYLLDLRWALTPAGDRGVAFVSDDVHYAWPFLRLDTPWNGEHGGRLVSDTGASGEEATNMKPALWIDYSNTVDGVTEGVAVFQFPDGRERRWLTREYGCFGPRRPDEQSGRPFALEAGETLAQRAGVLVHRGDAVSGRVRERYAAYVRGGSR